ncbi:TonB family protein [Leptolyngbyaceae cyanobacterium UHCC 1019]
MSSPSLPKNFPALFDSENRAKAGALLLQPMSLAVLASLGVHGLLWFGLPLMSASEPKQADSQRSVPLVELSPVEQARLPQLSGSPLLGLPKQSAETNSIVPNSLATVPVDPETPQDSTSYYSVPSQPSTSTIIQYSVAPPSKRSPKKSTDAANSDPDPKTQSSDKETEAETEQTEKESSEPPISSKAEDLLPSKQQEEQAKLALQQKFVYGTANTSPDDFDNNAKSFSKTAQDVSKGDLNEDWKKLDAMTAPYPKDACQFKHDDKAIAGETWVGVIVQPNGKLAAKPILLKSSGFQGLDEAAAEFMTQYSFEAGKQYRGFYVPIKFELNKTDCVAADASDPTS